MKGLTRAYFMASVCLAAAGSVPAFAQPEGERAADDIIVTARRVEERLQDVPISISVFNQQQLSNRNVFNASDLATYTPSLSTNNRFGAERSSFSIRGFTQEIGTAPSVAVYFADVVAPRAASLATSGNGAGVGSFFDLQNVQVLKGPQGTLFGRNTTGGAVLLVPQKPTGKLEGYVEGSVGNFDMWRVQGVLNVPLSDSIRVRLGVDRNKREGYMRNFSGIGPRDFNDTDYIALRGSIVADLAHNLENYLIVTYSDSDTNGNHLRLLTCNPAASSGAASVTAPLACAQLARQAARGPYAVESSIPDPYQRIEQWQAINTTTWRVADNLTVKNIMSYGEFRDATNTNFLGDNLISGGQSYSFVVVSPGLDGYLTAQRTFSEELQLQGNAFGGALDWQAGAYLEISDPIHPASQYQRTFLSCTDHTTFQCTPLFRGATSLGSITLPNQSLYFRNLGFYAQGTYKLTDQLRLTGGIRYTRDRTRALSENVSIAFPAANTPTFTCATSGLAITGVSQRGLCRLTFTAKSSKPTWLINLDYKPVEEVLLYAKYARGYRAGGVNPSAVDFEQWAPEKVDSYEVGAKTSFDGMVRGSFNVAAFYNKFSDQQLQASLNAARPVQAIINAGKSRIWGVEVDGMIEPVKGLRLEGSYTYLNTRVQQLNRNVPFDPVRYPRGISFTTFEGDPLTLAPKHKYSITGSYTLPLAESVGEVTLAATFSHTSPMLATRVTPIVANQTVPALDLLNLNVNWNGVGGMPVDVALFATNVTKEVVRTYTGAGYNSAGFDGGVFSEPRMYGVRVRYHFGR